ncbi:SGNH/GDSL hydrolase family protein [Bradyrhizobium sp. STM 3562]|uniref:SGNH/GDSL hydrolase family protein n=1 Tax=Bradyrhizobium sp. STM 3562 TaxID=578924 RepID=UPI003890C30B
MLRQTRLGLGLFAIAALAITAFLLARAHYAPVPGSDHRTARQLILHFALSRLDDPIIVLGDSNVEASTLPRSACGHAIVNAGLNGASTTSDLGGWLAAALAGKRAFAIVVSLGTNDALTEAPVDKQVFASRYEALLRELSQHTGRLFVVEIPSVEARQRLTSEMEKQIMATIRSFRSTLPDVATRTGASFLPLSEMSAPFTIDGVHFNAEGYGVWEQAVMQGVAAACG